MTCARYYFDDGKARKFWSYTLTGATLAVRHGRLGTDGRETKKTLASPAAAKQEAEKLADQKLRKGYIRVDPTLLRLVRLEDRRHATAAQVAALEKQLAATLPEEYRNFLLTHNGGHVAPEDGSFEVFGHPHPYGYIGSVRVFYTLQKNVPTYESLHYAIEQVMPRLPVGHLPITESGGNPITIDLQTKPGCIYLFDHELPEYNDYEDIEALEEKYGSPPLLMKHATLVAGTFEEFLTRIAVHGGEQQAAR
jgi:predicted DNA-binding WGR domain protein